uniref:Uncharacterized protein n=1 Tax=Arundo donax TaxID=35708 RepID=A0A0A8Z9W9_ARUDO
MTNIRHPQFSRGPRCILKILASGTFRSCSLL